jgi:Uma2 family endonuclease
MPVAMDHIPHRFTWDASIELRIVQELWLVDRGERVFHGLHPNGEYHEWVDGDVVRSPLLPAFEAAVADLISQAS